MKHWGLKCLAILLSGTQVMKTCLAEGVEPVGFEADAVPGGFWRYKEDLTFTFDY